MDEGGLVTEATAQLALALNPEQIVLIGDEKQMSARMNAPVNTEFRTQPMFHRAVTLPWLRKQMLVVQRRSTDVLMQAVNMLFYDNQLRQDPTVAASRDADNLRAGIWVDHQKPVTCVDVRTEEAQHPGQHSTHNAGEALECARIAKQIVDTSNGVFKAEDISLITCYKACLLYTSPSPRD